MLLTCAYPTLYTCDGWLWLHEGILPAWLEVAFIHRNGWAGCVLLDTLLPLQDPAIWSSQGRYSVLLGAFEHAICRLILCES